MHHAILAALLLAQGPPPSGPRSAAAMLTVNIESHARLTFSATALVFADADPDQVPVVPASPRDLAITARARMPRNAQLTLTMQASDDLRSGVTTIPASLIGWEAAGEGFVAGTLSRLTPQLVASWTGSGSRTGTQAFRFQNSWTHPPGTYSVTFVYTMSMP